MRTTTSTALHLLLPSLLVCAASFSHAEPSGSAQAGSQINYPYAHNQETDVEGPDKKDDGLLAGFYDVADEKTVEVKTKISHTFRSHKEHKVGLKLSGPIGIGFHAVKILKELDENNFDDIGDTVAKNIATLSIEPQLEMPIHVRNDWYLTPYQKIGITRDLANDDWIYTPTTGLKNWFPLPYEAARFDLSQSILYSFSESDSGNNEDDLARVDFAANWRMPFSKKIGKYHPHTYAYFKIGYYLNDLEFETNDGEKIKVNEEYEIGTQLGTEPRIRLFWKLLKIPRITVSYRFGDDLQAFNIRLGG